MLVVEVEGPARASPDSSSTCSPASRSSAEKTNLESAEGDGFRFFDLGRLLPLAVLAMAGSGVGSDMITRGCSQGQGQVRRSECDEQTGHDFFCETCPNGPELDLSREFHMPHAI